MILILIDLSSYNHTPLIILLPLTSHICKQSKITALSEPRPRRGRGEKTGIAPTEIPSYGISYDSILKFGFAKLEKADVSI